MVMLNLYSLYYYHLEFVQSLLIVTQSLVIVTQSFVTQSLVIVTQSFVTQSLVIVTQSFVIQSLVIVTQSFVSVDCDSVVVFCLIVTQSVFVYFDRNQRVIVCGWFYFLLNGLLVDLLDLMTCSKLV